MNPDENAVIRSLTNTNEYYITKCYLGLKNQSGLSRCRLWEVRRESVLLRYGFHL